MFFSFINIREISTTKYKYFPLFLFHDTTIPYPQTVLKYFTFCSLNSSEHLKNHFPNESLESRIHLFIQQKCSNQFKLSDIGEIYLLTHLSYFGYCFNPISIYYIYSKTNPSVMLCIITEVSNTPWIEQHCYMLHETVDEVHIIRQKGSFQAIWKKEFHVSPFMEMDYKYDFTFSVPSNSIQVNSKLIKLETSEVWFTASFELNKIAFSPLNLLYVLVFYPLHTRLIQVWIHWEAVLLFMKVCRSQFPPLFFLYVYIQYYIFHIYFIY